MTDSNTTANMGLAKVAVQCSADTFVVNQSLVLRINICGENRHLRQAQNRYTKFSCCVQFLSVNSTFGAAESGCNIVKRRKDFLCNS
jgi:hypothetical protein